MTRRAAARTPAPPPQPIKQLTPAEKAQATKSANAFRAERAAYKLGAQRDANNPCKVCRSDRVEILIHITPEGTREWTTHCLVCRPLLVEPGDEPVR